MSILLPRRRGRIILPGDEHARLDLSNDLARRFKAAYLPGAGPHNVVPGRERYGLVPTGHLNVRDAPSGAAYKTLRHTQASTILSAVDSFSIFSYPWTAVWAGRYDTTAGSGQLLALANSGGTPFGGATWSIGGGSTANLNFAVRHGYDTQMNMSTAVAQGSALKLDIVVVAQTLAPNYHQLSVNGQTVAVSTTDTVQSPGGLYSRLIFGGSANAIDHAFGGFSQGIAWTTDEMQWIGEADNLASLFEPAREYYSIPFAGSGPTYTGVVPAASVAVTLSTVAGVHSYAGQVASLSAAQALQSVAGVQSYVGTVSNATTATTVGSVAGSQVVAGAVSSLSTAVALSAVAGAHGRVGAVPAATVTTALSSAAGVQNYVGTVANASTAVTMSPAAGSQGGYNGTVASLAAATSMTPVAGVHNRVGTVTNLSTLTALGSVAGVQSYVGAVSTLSVAQTLQSVAGSTNGWNGTVAAAAVVTSLTPVAGVQSYVGSVAAAAVATTESPVAGTQGYQGTVTALAVAQTLQGVAGTTGGYVGAVSNSTTSTSVGAVAGVQGYRGTIPPITVATATSAFAGVHSYAGSTSPMAVAITMPGAGTQNYIGLVAPLDVSTLLSSVGAAPGYQGSVLDLLTPTYLGLWVPALALPTTLAAMRTYLVPVDFPTAPYDPVYQLAPPRWEHDPHATLDYAVDWSMWCADGGDTAITGTVSIITPNSGLVLGAQVVRNTFQLAAMLQPDIVPPVLGTVIDLRFRITTDQLRVDDRTISLIIKER